MTFDDGILAIYNVANAAAPGCKPVEHLELKEKYYYGYESLGLTRYYKALEADQHISCVVHIPGWNDVKVTDICELEDGNRYMIRMCQPDHDENGLRVMKLSLERMDQNYEVPG